MSTETIERREVADELVGPAPITTEVALLGPLQKIEAGLAALGTELAAKVYERNEAGHLTTAGDKAARKDRLRCVTIRTSTDEAYDTANAPVLKAQKDARAMRDAIKARVQEFESPLDSIIREDEDRKKAAKLEAERIEAARIAKHEANIATIRGYVKQCTGKTSAQIESGRNRVLAIMLDDSWQEFRDRAQDALTETLDALAAMRDQAKEAEEAVARFQAERVEAAKIAAENARVAAEQAAERKRLEDAAAVLRRQEAEAAAARAEQDRLAAAERRRQDEEAAAERQRQADQIAATQAALDAALKAASAPAVEVDSTPEPVDELPSPELTAAFQAIEVLDLTPVNQAPAVDEATIKLGELNALLAPISISAEGLAQLGYPAIPGKGVAKNYRRSDLIGICVAMVKHLETKAAAAK